MKTLLLIVIFALPVSLFAQTNGTAYDQLMTLAGTFVSNGNLEAAKQTAQQALELDNHEWRGNALMAAILEKQGDFTNAQIYVLKAIAAAPPDKLAKLTEMAQAIAVGEAQGNTVQTTQPEQPTLEQTVAWMKAHFADLACDIRVSGPYDATGTYHGDGGNLGVNTDTLSCNGNRAAEYALVPMEMIITNNILNLTIFELYASRYSGTEREENDYSAAPEDNKVDNNTDLTKRSFGTIHTLSINLSSISIGNDISEVYPVFRFGRSYLSQADHPLQEDEDDSRPIGATDDVTAYNAAQDEPSRMDIAAYQNNNPIYWLVIRGKDSNHNISDSTMLGGAISGEFLSMPNNSVFISDSSTIHSYTNLPPQISSPPGSWTDPNQNDTDPTAIKDWILANCQKELPPGDSDSPNTSLYPSAIAICNTDKNVLEQWRQAILRLIELNGGNGQADNLSGNNGAMTDGSNRE